MEIWELAHEYELNQDGWFFDVVRVLGVFATEQEAEAAKAAARELPGFSGTVNFEGENGLCVSCYQLDEAHWTTGFVREPYD